jgi:hypothetical protein
VETTVITGPSIAAAMAVAFVVTVFIVLMCVLTGYPRRGWWGVVIGVGVFMMMLGYYSNVMGR